MENVKVKKYKEKIEELKQKLNEVKEKIKMKNGKYSKLYPQKTGIEYDIKILEARIDLEIEKDVYKRSKDIFHKEGVDYFKEMIKKLQDERKMSVMRQREFWRKAD